MEIGQNGTARSWALELSVGARSHRTAGIRLWGKNGKKKEKEKTCCLAALPNQSGFSAKIYVRCKKAIKDVLFS